MNEPTTRDHVAPQKKRKKKNEESRPPVDGEAPRSLWLLVKASTIIGWHHVHAVDLFTGDVCIVKVQLFCLEHIRDLQYVHTLRRH